MYFRSSPLLIRGCEHQRTFVKRNTFIILGNVRVIVGYMTIYPMCQNTQYHNAKQDMDLFCLNPSPPPLQSTCHYIVNRYAKIWHVRLGGANNMHPPSWKRGGGTNPESRCQRRFSGLFCKKCAECAKNM